MTAIVRDLVLYRKKYFKVLNSRRLFQIENKYGFKLLNGDTFNPSGFHCDFVIKENILLLQNLSLQTSKEPIHGFLGFGKYPPTINNCNPSIEKETDVSVWTILYRDIYLNISFSGILTVSGNLNSDDLEDKDGEVENLEFERGVLVD